MKLSSIAISISIALALPVMATAAPFAQGTYQATDYDDNRSIWTGPNNNLSALSHLVTGTGVSNTWTVGGSSTFVYNATAGTAQLTGLAQNTGAAGADLGFSFVLDMVADPGGAPFGPDAWPVADWALFTLTGGSFTGLGGTDMAGLTYNITQKSTHGPQAGVGANDKDGALGFSMWYYWDRTDSNVQTTSNGYTFNTGGFGDFNMDLEFVNNNIDPIPLPAAAWMLLAGLGGLAAMSRRKS